MPCTAPWRSRSAWPSARRVPQRHRGRCPFAREPGLRQADHRVRPIQPRRAAVPRTGDGIDGTCPSDPRTSCITGWRACSPPCRRRIRRAVPTAADGRRAFASGVPGGWLWETDLQGRYTWCSPEVERFLGLAAVDLVGKDVRRVGLSDEFGGDGPPDDHQRTSGRRLPASRRAAATEARSSCSSAPSSGPGSMASRPAIAAPSRSSASCPAPACRCQRRDRISPLPAGEPAAPPRSCRRLRCRR